MINFDSLQKLTFTIVSVMLLAYCAVSPRTLPVVEYNMKFKENIEIICLVIIAPILISISVFDTEQNDVNACVSAVSWILHSHFQNQIL